MNFGEFCSTVKKLFEEFLQNVNEKIRNGNIKIKADYSFPSYLRIGESPHHWMAELTGAKEIININNYKLEAPNISEKYENTSAFFNPGVDIEDSMKPVFNIRAAKEVGFINLCIATNYDYTAFKKFINLKTSSTKVKYDSAEVPITIQSGCKMIYFYNVDLIRTENFKLFFKSIPTAIAVKKNITRNELKQFLKLIVKKLYKSSPPNIFGINIGYSYSSEKFARDLLSLTNQPIREPIIDRFIQKHSNFFTKGLGYQRGLSQIELKIIEGDFGDKKSLKPDYLMLRNDGFYDILDLKTSALKKKSISIGDTSRMRFNAYVSEMISQLVGYERYFKLEKNYKWVLENYDIKIKNPKLIGIVGSFQNFDRYQVDLALEQYKDNIAILSYSDLINLLRKNI